MSAATGIKRIAMSGLINLWNSPLRWSDLAKIGNSKVAKSTVIWIFLVPLFVRILKPINAIEISLGGNAFSVDLALPFYWEILFFASLFFALGTILHTIFCPKFLALYETYPQFKELGRGDRTILSVMSNSFGGKSLQRHLLS